VVVPDNVVFGRPGPARCPVLTEDCDLHTVLRLPNGPSPRTAPAPRPTSSSFTPKGPAHRDRLGLRREGRTLPGSRRKTGPSPTTTSRIRGLLRQGPETAGQTDAKASKEDRWRSFHISQVKERDSRSTASMAQGRVFGRRGRPARAGGAGDRRDRGGWRSGGGVECRTGPAGERQRRCWGHAVVLVRSKGELDIRIDGGGKSMHVSMDLPESAFLSPETDPESFVKEMRLAAAVNGMSSRWSLNRRPIGAAGVSRAGVYGRLAPLSGVAHPGHLGTARRRNAVVSRGGWVNASPSCLLAKLGRLDLLNVSLRSSWSRGESSTRSRQDPTAILPDLGPPAGDRPEGLRSAEWIGWLPPGTSVRERAKSSPGAPAPGTRQSSTNGGCPQMCGGAFNPHTGMSSVCSCSPTGRAHRCGPAPDRASLGSRIPNRPSVVQTRCGCQ